MQRDGSADVLVVMRRVVVPALAGLVVLVAVPAASGSRLHRVGSHCPRKGHGRILHRDSDALVYLGPERLAKGWPVNQEIWGCAYRGRHSYDIGTPAQFSSSGGGGVQHLELAGTMVAFEESATGHESYTEPTHLLSAEVVVVNLRNGQVLHRDPTGTPAQSEPRMVGAGPPTVLVLKSDGAVAWIAENAEESSESYEHNRRTAQIYYEVRAVDRSGSHLLAGGFDVRGYSLRLVGSTLSWTQGGERHSANLN